MWWWNDGHRWLIVGRLMSNDANNRWQDLWLKISHVSEQQQVLVMHITCAFYHETKLGRYVHWIVPMQGAKKCVFVFCMWSIYFSTSFDDFFSLYVPYQILFLYCSNPTDLFSSYCFKDMMAKNLEYLISLLDKSLLW